MPHVTFAPLTGFRIREAELREPPADWVREMYLEKFRDAMHGAFFYHGSPQSDIGEFLLIIDQLELKDCFEDDNWRFGDMEHSLRGLKEDKENPLSDELTECLDRVLKKLDSAEKEAER